jgi:hypothetical protein
VFNLFRAVIDRLKSLLALAAGLEPEVGASAHHADHKGQLLRLAELLEAEGLHAPARELRRQADALDRKHTMAGVAASLADWEGLGLHPALPAPPQQRVASIAQPASGRRKGS